MLCALSGEAPQEPVVSKLSGAIFEKRLIEKYIEENGKDPVSGEDLTLDDLLPIRSSPVVRPRPPTLTSIPSLLATFQNEWDALALEVYNTREELMRAREDLATALYQHDAAVRVIARLTKERDEARDALSKVTVSAGSAGAGDAMTLDPESLPEDLVAKVDEFHARLSKTRKKRTVPQGWATADDVASFAVSATNSLPVPQATTVSVSEGYAAIGGLHGDVAIYSIDSDTVERSFKVNEPVTSSIWDGTRVYLATSKGSIKVFENGSEIASFLDHAGPVTGLSIHPSKEILASIGSDKSFIFYDLVNLRRVRRVFTNSVFTTCAFHPDGHLFVCGTNSGEITAYFTTTGLEGASFTLGAPVQAIAFSENGYWFAATGKGQTTVTIFDLRKSGDAAQAKVIDTGNAVQSLAWDESQQFLATGGPSGVTVQHYNKSAKSWSEPLRAAVSAVDVQWTANANKLVAVNGDGVISVLTAKEE